MIRQSTLFLATKSIVGGIWSFSENVYGVIRDEVRKALDEETLRRLREKTNDPDLDMSQAKSLISFNQEREKVKKEAKEIGIKGGVIALGLGLLFGGI